MVVAGDFLQETQGHLQEGHRYVPNSQLSLFNDIVLDVPEMFSVNLAHTRMAQGIFLGTEGLTTKCTRTAIGSSCCFVEQSKQGHLSASRPRGNAEGRVWGSLRLQQPKNSNDGMVTHFDLSAFSQGINLVLKTNAKFVYCCQRLSVMRGGCWCKCHTGSYI